MNDESRAASIRRSTTGMGRRRRRRTTEQAAAAAAESGVGRGRHRRAEPNSSRRRRRRAPQRRQVHSPSTGSWAAAKQWSRTSPASPAIGCRIAPRGRGATSPSSTPAAGTGTRWAEPRQCPSRLNAPCARCRRDHVRRRRDRWPRPRPMSRWCSSCAPRTSPCCSWRTRSTMPRRKPRLPLLVARAGEPYPVSALHGRSSGDLL